MTELDAAGGGARLRDPGADLSLDRDADLARILALRCGALSGVRSSERYFREPLCVSCITVDKAEGRQRACSSPVRSQSLPPAYTFRSRGSASSASSGRRPVSSFASTSKTARCSSRLTLGGSSPRSPLSFRRSRRRQPPGAAPNRSSSVSHERSIRTRITSRSRTFVSDSKLRHSFCAGG